MEGIITKVYKNYGIIKAKTDEKDVKFMFYIFPDMIKNGKYQMSKEVTFDISKLEVRNSKSFIAYNIKPLRNSEMKEFSVKDEKIKNYPYHIYKDFFQVDDDELLERLIAEDERFKEFTLKWVLFLEKNTRKIIVDLVDKYKIDRNNVYHILKENKETKKNHKQILKELGSRYKLRPEFRFLTIERKNENDDINFNVLDAPLSLYLENTTLDKLSLIVKVLCSSVFNNIDENEEKDIKFLKRTLEMFGDLSVIRNAAAHGRPLIPVILDDNYVPSDLYDLSSVDPKFNSGNDVTQWKLFNPIRYVTRQLAKSGIAFTYFDGVLQHTGLYTAKYILGNPARRSFFSYLYILGFYFEFVDNGSQEEFMDDLEKFMSLNSKEKEDLLLEKYPQDNSVISQFLKFTYPLLDEIFWIMVDNGISM